MNKRLKKALSVVGVLLILSTMFAMPILAYSGLYGNLSMNMLNYDALTKAEFRLTDSYYKTLVNNNVYSFNHRSDLTDGQWELYSYYSTKEWYAKSTSYIPFKTLFPYVKSGDNLILSYYTNISGENSVGMYITVRDGTKDNGYPKEYNITTHYAIQVTELMISQGYCEIRLSHNANMSNNVYLRALGAYSGQAVLPDSNNAGTGAWKAYARAIYNPWQQTKEYYQLATGTVDRAELDTAYGNGYTEGTKDGYIKGYDDGMADADQSVFANLVNACFTAPLNFLNGLMGWELFGINLWQTFRAIFTIVLLLGIVGIVLKVVF